MSLMPSNLLFLCRLWFLQKKMKMIAKIKMKEKLKNMLGKSISANAKNQSVWNSTANASWVASSVMSSAYVPNAETSLEMNQNAAKRSKKRKGETQKHSIWNSKLTKMKLPTSAVVIARRQTVWRSIVNATMLG